MCAELDEELAAFRQRPLDEAGSGKAVHHIIRLDGGEGIRHQQQPRMVGEAVEDLPSRPSARYLWVVSACHCSLGSCASKRMTTPWAASGAAA